MPGRRRSSVAEGKESGTGFLEVKAPVLDHLVPEDQRQLAEQQDEAFLEATDGLSLEEKAGALQTLVRDCRAIESAIARERNWSSAGTQRALEALQDLIQRQTPEEEHYQAREAVVSRIDSIVKQGLLQFDGLHVDHYGSFTSGLFSPTGDLDIAVEGILRLRTDRLNKGKQELEKCNGLNVAQLNKDEKAIMLRSLCKALQRKSITDGRIERILHARVPIIKFVDWASGIPCDMAIGSGGARFKSTVLRHLTLADSRFADLVRLVKQWAQAFHMNDASNGTFNTFALTLMVVFHLQTRSPPILPPICELFGMPPDEVEGRPLHRGRPANVDLLQGSQMRAEQWPKSENTESVLELLNSFFAVFTTAVGIWTDKRSVRAVRCCPWAGKWAFKPWPHNYIVPIEDPFDSTDNCARSIFAANAGYVKDCFFQGMLALRDLRSPQAADFALRALFTLRDAPFMRHPFRNGNRWQEGWGRTEQGDRSENGQGGSRSGYKSPAQSTSPGESKFFQSGYKPKAYVPL